MLSAQTSVKKADKTRAAVRNDALSGRAERITLFSLAWPTELKLASILRAHGITGWRRHQPLIGSPDFLFRHKRLAVFVDGCFWHGCRWHCRMPKANRPYWKNKIARNASRDRAANSLLQKAGWRVVRIWGHSLRSPKSVATRITSALSAPCKQCKTAPRVK